MIMLRHVRFSLWELAQALECYGKLRRPSISEALSYYYNWALRRGWRLKAVLGLPVPQARRIWVAMAERSSQLEIQERDQIYEVVWQAESEPIETCDFLEAYPVVDPVTRIVEELEDRGWAMDPDRDGFSRIAMMDDGVAEERYISGFQIYQASMALRSANELDGVVAGLVDGLEAQR